MNSKLELLTGPPFPTPFAKSGTLIGPQGTLENPREYEGEGKADEAYLEAASGGRMGGALAFTPWNRARAVCLGAISSAAAVNDTTDQAWELMLLH